MTQFLMIWMYVLCGVITAVLCDWIYKKLLNRYADNLLGKEETEAADSQ